MIDCHTHINQFNAEEIPEVIERARDAALGVIIAAGTTVTSSKKIVELCEAFDCVYGGVGVHPMDLNGRLNSQAASDLTEVASHPKIIVWSETGLDYLPSSPAKEIQHESFRIQIQLARHTDLPLVVHSREADTDTVKILKEENAIEVGGAWHYFQGDLNTAQEVMDLGFYISFAKPLLRLPELQDVASRIPLNRIVVETDSFPQPFKKYRHRWTEPSHVVQVIEKLAELHEISYEEMAETTTSNALKLLRNKVTLW